MALLAFAPSVEAQEQSTRYSIGDDSNNRVSDTIDFDRSLPMLTEGDGKLYYIRDINIHGVKYLNHDILKQSAGLMEGAPEGCLIYCEEKYREDFLNHYTWQHYYKYFAR